MPPLPYPVVPMKRQEKEKSAPTPCAPHQNQVPGYGGLDTHAKRRERPAGMDQPADECSFQLKHQGLLANLDRPGSESDSLPLRLQTLSTYAARRSRSCATAWQTAAPSFSIPSSATPMPTNPRCRPRAKSCRSVPFTGCGWTIPYSIPFTRSTRSPSATGSCAMALGDRSASVS